MPPYSEVDEYDFGNQKRNPRQPDTYREKAIHALMRMSPENIIKLGLLTVMIGWNV